MDITCNKCGTEYVLDDTLISVSGTKVRCMTCDHVFKVFRDTDSEPDQWVLRQTHGPIRTFTKLAKIQEWIVEGKVTMDDLISRKNGPWKKIGDIAELNALFKQAEAKKKRTSRPSRQKKVPRIKNQDATIRHGIIEPSVAKVVKPKAPSRSTLPPPTPKVPKKERMVTSEAPTPLATPKSVPISEKPLLSKSAPEKPLPPKKTEIKGTRFEGVKIPAMDAGRPTFSEALPSAPVQTEKQGPDFSKIPTQTVEKEQWESGDKLGISDPQWTGISASKKLPTFEQDELLPPKGRWIRYAALGTAGFLVLVGLFCFLFVPSIGQSVMSHFDTMVAPPQTDRYKKFFDRGQESFLLDSDAAFLQADREFQKVLALEENHPETLAALAKLYGVWAQYLRDAKLDAMADAAEAAAETDDTPSKAIEQLDRDFQEKLKEAERWANLANGAKRTSQTALLSLADILRMKGKLDEASEYLKKASDIRVDSEAEYISILIDIEKRDPADGLIKRLTELVADHPILRVLYRQARLSAAAGQKETAVAAVNRLLSLNPNHERGRVLKARINDEKPVWMVEADKDRDHSEPSGEMTEKEKRPKIHSKGEAVKSEGDDGTRGISGLLLRAKRLRKRGRNEEARSVFEKIIEMSPANLEAHSGLGYYYVDKGNNGKAIASFRRCLTMSPNYGPAIIGLAETYKFAGQKDQAMKYYQMYVKTNPGGGQVALAKRNIDRLGGGQVLGGGDESAEKANETDAPESAVSPVAPTAPKTPETPEPPEEESKKDISDNPSPLPEPTEEPPKKVIIIDTPESNTPSETP